MYTPKDLLVFQTQLGFKVQNIFQYLTSTDDLAAVAVSDYFDPSVSTDSSTEDQNLADSLQINDLLNIVATDGYRQFKVTALAPVVIEEVISSVGVIVASGQFVDAGGSPNIAIPDAAIPANGIGWATMESSVNPVFPIATLVTGGQIGITFSADPGASTIHYWVTSQ